MDRLDVLVKRWPIGRAALALVVGLALTAPEARARGAETVAPAGEGLPALLQRFAQQAPSAAAASLESSAQAVAENVGDSADALSHRLTRAKAALDAAADELIERTGLAELGLTPNHTYGIALGALAGVYAADVMGGNGLMTAGLTVVGGYLGGGVATGAATPVAAR